MSFYDDDFTPVPGPPESGWQGVAALLVLAAVIAGMICIFTRP